MWDRGLIQTLHFEPQPYLIALLSHDCSLRSPLQCCAAILASGYFYVDLNRSLSQRVRRHMLTWYPVMVILSGVDSERPLLSCGNCRSYISHESTSMENCGLTC